MRQALAELNSIETGTGKLRCICLLAAELLEDRQIGEAQTLLDEAMEILERTGEHAFQSDIFRTQGDLFAVIGDSDAEFWYRRAIQVACGQQGKSLELRAVIRLCRLLQKQGQIEQAHRMLNDCYAWFTEGFETADLREAAEL